MRPILLDGFCKAGGAGKGYHDAGFDVVGVDIEPQPNYPFEFIQADWFEYMREHWREYDAFHISPPCQRYSEQTNPAYKDKHPDLIAPSRRLLLETGRPYVIENVEGALKELISPIKLCGTMFGLPIWRHRLFECPSIPFFFVPPCKHIGRPILITGMGSTPRKDKGGVRYKSPVAEKRTAIGIDWMTTEEITEAIPPAFTEFIGKHLMAHLSPAPSRADTAKGE